MSLEQAGIHASRSMRRGAIEISCKLVGKRLTVWGEENFPANGPFIAAWDIHASPIDPVIIGGLTPRLPITLGKKEVFEYPLLGELVSRLGGIPINRGQVDRRAIEASLEALEEGSILSIALSGTRYRGPEEEVALQRANPGAVYIAQRYCQELMEDLPVVPIAISGTEGVFRLFDIKEAPVRDRFGCRRREINVLIGDSIKFSPLDDTRGRFALRSRNLQPKADEIGRAIADLLPDRYRGYYNHDG